MEAAQPDGQFLGNFIGGEYRPALDGRTSDVVDPSTGEAYLRAPVSGPADVDAALRAAAAAFGTWRDTTPAERSLALLRFADAIEARAEELVDAESRNTGKPVALTRTDEVPPLADELRFFAGAARMLEGRSALPPARMPDASMLMRQKTGVRNKTRWRRYSRSPRTQRPQAVDRSLLERRPGPGRPRTCDRVTRRRKAERPRLHLLQQARLGRALAEGADPLSRPGAGRSAQPHLAPRP